MSMLGYSIAAAIILACAIGIFSIVVRKFPQLTLIDTEAIPLERDAKKKNAIMHDRASRMTAAFGRRIASVLTRWFERVRARFRATYRRLLILQRQYRPEKQVPPGEIESRIAALFEEAERLRKAGEYGDAEKRYIDILTLDVRSTDAYWGLGALYVEAKRYDQAKETFAYLVRMIRKDARCLHDEGGRSIEARPCAASPAAHADIAAGWLETGLAASAAGDQDGALDAFERAVAFEPANPRHLDLLLDACILEGDKSRASEVLAQLRGANPENNKLDSFAERIAALPDAPSRRDW